MQLTASQVRYLLAIYGLSAKRAEVSSSDIAAKLNVTRPSVNKMLQVLSDKKLLEKKRYGSARLTNLGNDVSKDYDHRVMRLAEKLTYSLDMSIDDINLCSIIIISELPNLSV